MSCPVFIAVLVIVIMTMTPFISYKRLWAIVLLWIYCHLGVSIVGPTNESIYDHIEVSNGNAEIDYNEIVAINLYKSWLKQTEQKIDSS